MPTGHTTPLPLDLGPRHATRRGASLSSPSPAWRSGTPCEHEAAEAAFHERHPTRSESEAQRTVALMISAVARDHPTWRWKRVGAVNR
jgi:hypothetical protein